MICNVYIYIYMSYIYICIYVVICYIKALRSWLVCSEQLEQQQRPERQRLEPPEQRDTLVSLQGAQKSSKFGGFLRWGYPHMDGVVWRNMENPSNVDDLEVPLFQETCKCVWPSSRQPPWCDRRWWWRPARRIQTRELTDPMELQAWSKLAWLPLGKKLEPALVQFPGHALGCFRKMLELRDYSYI